MDHPDCPLHGADSRHPLPELETLAERIEALRPPDRLRLAAALLEEGKGDVAHSIVRKIADELGVALELRRQGTL